MGNPHSYTTKYVNVIDGLKAVTKPLRSFKAKRNAIRAAAAGRPRDLPEQARVSVALRRIAGTPSRIDSQEGK